MSFWHDTFPGGAPRLPALTEVLAEVRVVELPLTVAFRGVRSRELAVFRGAVGWGEFAPFLEYDDEESAAWLQAAIEAAWWGWPAPVRESVPINATVPAVDTSEVGKVLAKYDGCGTIKIKVAQAGQRLDDDYQRVRAVREHAGDNVKLRVDANGAWSVPQALEAAELLAPFHLEYIEQPVSGVRELTELRRQLVEHGQLVKIAADESVRKAEDPLEVARQGAADLVVIKAIPLGGVRAALQVTKQGGLPAVVSSSLDSSIGILAGVALASAVPELEYACGLGTASLLAADIVDEPLVPVGGVLSLRQLNINEQSLRSHQVSPERRLWWTERISRAYRVLANQYRQGA